MCSIHRGKWFPFVPSWSMPERFRQPGIALSLMKVHCLVYPAKGDRDVISYSLSFQSPTLCQALHTAPSSTTTTEKNHCFSLGNIPGWFSQLLAHFPFLLARCVASPWSGMLVITGGVPSPHPSSRVLQDVSFQTGSQASNSKHLIWRNTTES